jgi:hypothetical protein
MSTAAALVRILASLTVTAAPAAAFAGPTPAVTTGDAVAIAPGQVENTGGNVTLGTPAPAESPPASPGVNNAPPNVPAPNIRRLPPPSPAAPPPDAAAAVADAHRRADEAHQEGMARAEEARRQAAEASARAHARGEEGRQQGQSAQSQYTDD